MDNSVEIDVLRLAETALEAGDVERALGLYQEELAQSGHEIGDIDFVLSIGTSVCFARMRRWSEADTALTDVVARYPKSGMALAYRGAARFEFGQHDAALNDLDAAIALAPNEAITWVKRGEVRWRLGLLKDALSDFGRAAKLPMIDETTRDYVRTMLTQVRSDLNSAVERKIPTPADLMRKLPFRRSRPAPVAAATPLAWRNR